MDVNANAEIKGVGFQQPLALEREQKNKPQVAPVAESNDSSQSALDEKRLHGQGESIMAKAVQDIQERLDSMGTKLGIELNKDPDAIVVQVKDKESGEVIRQFPPKELLQLQKKLKELTGLLFDEKV